MPPPRRSGAEPAPHQDHRVERSPTARAASRSARGVVDGDAGLPPRPRPSASPSSWWYVLISPVRLASATTITPGPASLATTGVPFVTFQIVIAIRSCQFGRDTQPVIDERRVAILRERGDRAGSSASNGAPTTQRPTGRLEPEHAFGLLGDLEGRARDHPVERLRRRLVLERRDREAWRTELVDRDLGLLLLERLRHRLGGARPRSDRGARADFRRCLRGRLLRCLRRCLRLGLRLGSDRQASRHDDQDAPDPHELMMSLRAQDGQLALPHHDEVGEAIAVEVGPEHSAVGHADVERRALDEGAGVVRERHDLGLCL